MELLRLSTVSASGLSVALAILRRPSAGAVNGDFRWNRRGRPLAAEMSIGFDIAPTQAGPGPVSQGAAQRRLPEVDAVTCVAS